MGLFDKLKNVFIEEDFEDEIESKKEVELEKNDEIEQVKTEKATIREGMESNGLSDRELLVSKDAKEKFKFPVVFEDDDFVEEKKKTKSINILEKENNKYEPDRREVKRDKKIFKPSPVISPVYGILDKDYSKEEINTKDGLLNDFDKDIDYVIKKASGEYTSREEKASLEKEIGLFKEDEKIEDVFINTEDLEVVNEDVESKAMLDEKIKSIDELLKNTSDEDFYSLVDSMYKDDESNGDEE